MRPLHRIFALLTLLGWLFAAGHVAFDHGGVVDGGVHHALPGGADADDHDGGAPQDGHHHHHHDFSALSASQGMKYAGQIALAPVWVPLCDALAERLTATLREGREPRLRPACDHAPPDGRAFGWLLVCQTALPVRGPSLAV